MQAQQNAAGAHRAVSLSRAARAWRLGAHLDAARGVGQAGADRGVLLPHLERQVGQAGGHRAHGRAVALARQRHAAGRGQRTRVRSLSARQRLRPTRLAPAQKQQRNFGPQSGLHTRNYRWQATLLFSLHVT